MALARLGGHIPIQIALLIDLSSRGHFRKTVCLLLPFSTVREAHGVGSSPRCRCALTRGVCRLLQAEQDARWQLRRRPPLPRPSLVANLPVVVLEDLGVQVKVLVLLVNDGQLPGHNLIILDLLLLYLLLAYLWLWLRRTHDLRRVHLRLAGLDLGREEEIVLILSVLLVHVHAE